MERAFWQEIGSSRLLHGRKNIAEWVIFVYFWGLFLEKSTYFQKQPITFLNKRTFSKNPVDVKKSRENSGQYTDQNY